MQWQRWFASCALVAWLATTVGAAEFPTAEFPLWTGDAPGALGKAETDIPTLVPFRAENSTTGATIIVCPGGGYNTLAAHEGEPFARYLNQLGVNAFVLKYRLVKNGYHLPEILGDAARAMRTVRYHAAEWKLDPAKIGIMGSSAGGHLSATLLTQNDDGNTGATDPIEQVSSKPDLGVLCYAFILFDRPDPKGNRQERFLGANPAADQIRKFSPALNVSDRTAPTFVWQTVEDPGVIVDNALVFSHALAAAKVPFELHLYEKGRHGIGLGATKAEPDKRHPWTDELARWLVERGFAPGK